MKTIIFFRHGKSDWAADYDGDHARPLKKRGRKAARRMGRFLTETRQVPDSVVASTAVRVQQTLELAQEAGGWSCPVRTERALYSAAPETVLAVIRAEPATTDVLLLIGHEPTWSETIGRLIGGGNVRMPTAAMARIDHPVAQWQAVRFGDGQLIWLMPPKGLP